jgi:hypothetical protein
MKGSLLQGMAQIPTKTGTFPVSKGAAWWIFLLVFSWLYLVFPLEPPGAMLRSNPGWNVGGRHISNPAPMSQSGRKNLSNCLRGEDD